MGKREARAQQHGLLERIGGRDAPAGDVESSAVRRSGEGNFQAGGDGDATLEALELGRDLALVVVHAEHSVILPGERLEEDGIRREGSSTADSTARGLGHSRRNDLNLLTAK